MSVRVIIVGPAGQMGRALVQVGASRQDVTLVAGVGPAGRDYIGRDLGQVGRLGYDLNAPVVADLQDVIAGADAVVDFSTREAGVDVAKVAAAHKKVYVCGTTGFDAAQMAVLDEVAKAVPVVNGNTSKMVHLTLRLAEVAAEVLGQQADIEILDFHDRWKLDAPSGTANVWAESLAKIQGFDAQQAPVYGRSGVDPRREGTIGMHSVRAGNIPSSHTVFLGGIGERIEVTHHAYNFDCFAAGALDAAVYLQGKPAGWYSLRQVFGIRSALKGLVLASAG